MKVLILDSGTIINLSMNGLLYILEKIKKVTSIKILITKYVKQEVVDRPLGVERFELEALRVQNLIDLGILEMPESLGISENELDEKMNELMNIANHYLQINNKWISIVSEAEMSCLAISSELINRGIENLIGIDERTTRMLCENPINLEKLMSAKLHQKVSLISRNMTMFAPYRFIRSTELVYIAYKKGLIDIKGKKVLEALLYATKFKGSSISFEEINILKKM